MYRHAFQWQRKHYTLAYFIEQTVQGLQLVLEDVTAHSLETVNSIPDWVVEREACKLASYHGARYL